VRRTAGVWWALVRATWGEQLSRKPFVVLCLIYAVAETIGAVQAHELADPTLLLTVLLGAGSIGRDLTSGVLPLLFTRPLTRATYVLAKWLAVSSVAAIGGLLALVIQALLLSHRGFGPAGSAIGAALFGAVSTAAGIAAVLVFLSTLVSGFGDLGLWMILRLAGFLAGRWLGPRFTEEWGALVTPSLSWETLSGWDAGAWFRLVSYLSTVTLFLCLAVVVANHKEVSYATG
jgi:hypothetical protein